MNTRMFVCICMLFLFLVYDVNCQVQRLECTSEIKRNGVGCQTRIEVEADILRDIFNGQGNKVEFCKSDFENCVRAVQLASDRKCPGVNASDEQHHARVNALRGFCIDISAWLNYKPCVDNQINQGIKVCMDQYFLDKANYTQNEFNKEMYPTEYAKRNAFCRLIRGNQECNERAIWNNCRNYGPYFRDYQVALLIPYCRQLYQIYSRYTTDDPNGSATLSHCVPIISTMLVISFYLKKVT